MKHFVLLLTFIFLTACSSHPFYVSKIEGKKIGISDKQIGVSEIENYIKPYREHIDKDLNEILAYCPETLDKTKGQWQTNIGCFLAESVLLLILFFHKNNFHRKLFLPFLSNYLNLLALRLITFS